MCALARSKQNLTYSVAFLLNQITAGSIQSNGDNKRYIYKKPLNIILYSTQIVKVKYTIREKIYIYFLHLVIPPIKRSKQTPKSEVVRKSKIRQAIWRALKRKVGIIASV